MKSPVVLAAALGCLAAIVTLGCASSPARPDAPPGEREAEDHAPAEAAVAPTELPWAGFAGVSGDSDELVTDVSITYKFPDGRSDQARWGYGGGGTVNGVTRVSFKPKADVLTPNAGFMLLGPVEQGRVFDIGPADGMADGSGQVLLVSPTQEAFNVSTGTVRFSRVERLAPGALEVDGVMDADCISLTTPGRTLKVVVTFNEMILGG